METSSFDPKKCLQLFKNLLDTQIWKYATKKEKLNLPVFSEEIVTQILQKTTEIFQNEESMLNVQSPVFVVGDLHGNLVDLLTILKSNGSPPWTRYVFLGDLIDRGEFSIETILFIYLMKICFPKDVFIIRGNHEISGVCIKFGFKREIAKKYTSKLLFKSFCRTFSFTPFAALIDSHILCIHGGIGPFVKSIKAIANVKRPITRLHTKQAPFDILWSDPNDNCVVDYEKSPRGYGHLFGKEHCIEFEKNNGLSLIIRGHEVATSGVNYGFDGRILTVFSASNYCQMANDGGVVEVLPGGHVKAHTHRAYPEVLRAEDAFFYVPFAKNDKKVPFKFPDRKRVKETKIKVDGKTVIRRVIRRTKYVNRRRSKSVNNDIANEPEIITLASSPKLDQSKSHSVFGDVSVSNIFDDQFPDSAVEMSHRRRVKKHMPSLPLPPNPMKIKTGDQEEESDSFDGASELPSPSVIDGLDTLTMRMKEIPWSSARRAQSVKGRKRVIRKKRTKSPLPKPPQDSTSSFIVANAKPPLKKKKRVRSKTKETKTKESSKTSSVSSKRSASPSKTAIAAFPQS